MGFQNVDAAEHPSALVGYLNTQRPGIDAETQTILGLLDVGEGDTVIDIGCGTGTDLLLLCELVGATGTVVGIDRSAKMLDTARVRCAREPAVRLVAADAAATGLRSGTIDRCLIARVLQHVTVPAAVLEEAFRVLCAGGRIVVSEPDWESLVVWPGDADLVRRIVEHRADHIRHGRIGRRLRALLHDAGFVELGSWTTAGQGHSSLDLADRLLGLQRAARTAADAGVVTPESAAKWTRDLHAADAEGTFFAALTRFVVVAERPASGPSRMHIDCAWLNKRLTVLLALHRSC